MKTLKPCLALVALLAPSIARAATPAVCTDSYLEAQRLRKDGKIVEARASLRTCSAATCPGLIVNDCTKWLDEVQSSIPSIVPVATDDTGANLTDVRVSLDGAPAAAVPPGQPLEVDPGSHRVRFERSGFPGAETNTLVAIGQKNKVVAVTLHAAGAAGAGSGSPYRTVGIVVAGVGLAGLAVGAGFGADAIAKKSDANCPDNVCGAHGNAGALRDAGTAADVSTVSFIAGGVLTASGVLTWLLAPTHAAERRAWVRPVPMVSCHGGGMSLVGQW
jgi:hypothetical protein